MKLTDEQIDKLFQDGASKQSFAYKPEYWEEFAASLSDSASLSDATDEALDAAFQQSAANQSFDYKPEFWEEFSASLPENTPLSQAPDSAFDAAFQEDASKISVDYKPEFWNEFSNELSSIEATENVADAEVDALYREEAAKLSFVYHPSYWEEMAAMLRRRRRRPEFLWFGLSGVFATAIIAMFFVQQSPVSVPNLQLAWNGLNPTEQNNQNTDLASNGTNNSIDGNHLNTNNADSDGGTNENNPISAVNVGNNPSNRMDNGNGATPVNGTATNQSNILANNPRSNANNTVVLKRMERLKPTLALTALHNEMTTREVTSTSTTEEEALNALTPKSVGTLTEFNNELAQTEAFPIPPKYKGGVSPRFYVQGVGGISESLITPSDAFGVSYGVGAGIQMQKRNWTFNLGSNVIIENFSDLELTRVAKQYEHFSSTVSRHDLQYRNLYTVEMNLGVGYNIGRHQLRLGVRPSYTYNARVDYSETSIYNNQGEMVESNESYRGQFGYLKALQLWGIKPTIGYAYNFPSNWSLGLNLGTELMPSINEGFISGVNNRLPLDGQLYIRKTLNFTTK
ncbi:MAG: hypothetical protein ACFHU9_15415 [Fluviicola sp.]